MWQHFFKTINTIGYIIMKYKIFFHKNMKKEMGSFLKEILIIFSELLGRNKEIKKFCQLAILFLLNLYVIQTKNNMYIFLIF